MPHGLTLISGLGVVLSLGGFGFAFDPAGPDRVPPESLTTPTLGGTTTLTVNGCDFTVTYAWSGLTGRNLIATFGLSQRANGLDMSIVVENTPGQVGKGGSVSHTFSLKPNGNPSGRTIVGRGSLVDSKKYGQVSGSASASTNTVFSTCG